MLQAVQEAIEARPRDSALVLLADFDGTLAEFDPNPAKPILSEVRKSWLLDCAAQPHTFVGIVSGRRIADLRRRAPLAPHCYYAGLHGMEVEIGSIRWQHPDLDRAREHVKQLLPRLIEIVERVPGAIVEDKSVSIGVHVRGVSYERRAVALAMADACALPWLESSQLKRMEGSLVVEYLPNIAAHKGDAARWIAADVSALADRPAWTVFIGDDVTDEDAFRAIAPGQGIGVLVGSRATAATHQLAGISDVDTLLRWLATQR